jgi:hypothetical protein
MCCKNDFFWPNSAPFKKIKIKIKILSNFEKRMKDICQEKNMFEKNKFVHPRVLNVLSLIQSPRTHS